MPPKPPSTPVTAAVAPSEGPVADPQRNCFLLNHQSDVSNTAELFDDPGDLEKGKLLNKAYWREL